MKLPYTSRENYQKGQILIVFLLVLVVGLAIALSIASRTVTDVRQTTTSDESNRAYFAAEAGVENALKLIEENTLTSSNVGTDGDTVADVNLTGTNRSNADVIVKNLSIDDGDAFEYPNTVNQDDVAQINLMADFNNIATAGVRTGNLGILNTDTLEFYWGEAGTSSNAAIEVSIVSCVGNPCSDSSNFTIKKMIFDQSSRITNACNGLGNVPNPLPINTNLRDNVDFNFRATLNLNPAGSPCASNDELDGSDRPVLLRIRMLYDNAKLAVKSSGAINYLPNQGFDIESLGEVGSGVARKLKVYRLYPALPAVFDYVLYNGSSSNPLSK